MRRIADFRRVRRRSRRFWLLAAVIAAALGAVSAATVAWEALDNVPATVAAAVLAGAILGGLVVGVAVGVRSLNESAHTRAFINVRPLLGSLPIPANEWAIDAIFAEVVVTEIERREPGLVVECGSGVSTLLFASCLEALGVGRLVTFEHDEEFASQTDSLARHCGCANRVEIVVGPLRPHRLGGQEVLWYSGLEALDGQEPVEILVVDGPPGTTAPLARYPALPLLFPFLAPGASVFLHDGKRAAERETARRWGVEVGFEPVYVDSPLGGWLLRAPEYPMSIESPLRDGGRATRSPV
jgi:methyltransferase family protein